MSRRLHSAEPWAAVRERPGADDSVLLVDLVGPGGLVATLCLQRGGRGGPGDALGHPDDDVRRIVACVNACEGVGRPDGAVEAARDALRAALDWLEGLHRRAGRGEMLDDAMAATRPGDAFIERLREARAALGLGAGELLARELMGQEEPE